MYGLRNDVSETTIREALKEYGDISMVRLDKLNIHFYPVIRIGYVVFEQSAQAHRLIEKFREDEKLKTLFDSGNADFKFLFAPSNLNKRFRQQPRSLS